ncbi:hypothetical protein L6164_011484 [Bauhinia variegata]|uniref:Uncharacterized protein n=1 Tax=Bauhinia variegata TaxID=167791 RepID=A0ACB9P623_BAUVA|nr:hypothetical protein L6164_011484 [Bauhinia variegata]
MATGAAADGLFRSVFEGCISGYDNDVERRPYHRNCGCALHSKSGKNSTRKLANCNHVSYPMRRSWSEGSLTLMASAHSSPSSSPTAPGAGGKRQSGLLDLLEEDI